jgi:hypothetical protein
MSPEKTIFSRMELVEQLSQLLAKLGAAVYDEY